MQLRQLVFRQLIHYAAVLEEKYADMAAPAEKLHADASESWAKKRRTLRASPYGGLA